MRKQFLSLEWLTLSLVKAAFQETYTLKHTHTTTITISTLSYPPPSAPYSILLCICLPATKAGEIVIQTIRNSLSKSDQLVFPCQLYQDKKKKKQQFFPRAKGYKRKAAVWLQSNSRFQRHASSCKMFAHLTDGIPPLLLLHSYLV